MSRSPRRLICGFVLALSCLFGCAPQEAASTPAAPEMPPGWTIVSDEAFGQAAIRPIADQLGGEVTALRNTDYEVNGKKIRLNTIVPGSETDAAKIMAALRAVKPEEFLLRRDDVIFEFVGEDDAIPEMRAAKEHLRSRERGG